MIGPVRIRRDRFRSGRQRGNRRRPYGPRGILSWTRYQFDEAAKASMSAAQQIIMAASSGAGIVGGSDNPKIAAIWYTAAMLAAGVGIATLNYHSKKREAANKELYDAQAKAGAQSQVDENNQSTDDSQVLKDEIIRLRKELATSEESRSKSDERNGHLKNENGWLRTQLERLIQSGPLKEQASTSISSQQKPVQNQPQIGSARALEDRRGRGRSAGSSHSGRRI